LQLIDTSFRARRRSLLIALGANAAFLVVELVGGYLFGSLALYADAVHLTSDVLALGLALAALAFAQRPATERHTYGFERAEVLAAQANGVLLFAGGVAIVVEAVRRLASPQPIDAVGVLVIGAAGVVVNVVSALALARTAHGNLNMRAALWHLALDAVGSLAVVVSAVGYLAFGWERLDPIASLVIAGLVFMGAWNVLRDTARVLLEGVPSDVDVPALRAALEHETGVEAVHHVHVWSLGSESSALSAHVVLTGPLSLHDAQERATQLKTMLADRFGIEHATLEVECHACIDDPVHTGPIDTGRSRAASAHPGHHEH
jgi:cobalt-zinc-cadmium efflux system protein